MLKWASLLCLFCACGAPMTGAIRTYVLDTDHLSRGNSWQMEMPVLLSAPPSPYKDIGTVGAIADAQEEDDDIWRALTSRARRLGANAIQLVRREVYDCVRPGSTAGFAMGSVAALEGQGPSQAVCVRIIAKALITPQTIKCSAVSICREK